MWRISGNVPALQPKYRDLATLETKTPAAARGPAAPLRFLRANDVLTQLSLFGNGLEDNGAAAGCVPPHEPCTLSFSRTETLNFVFLSSKEDFFDILGFGARSLVLGTLRRCRSSECCALSSSCRRCRRLPQWRQRCLPAAGL
jgi:hypothetical protein